jgi:membrane-anchored mycosin MYCP
MAGTIGSVRVTAMRAAAALIAGWAAGLALPVPALAAPGDNCVPAGKPSRAVPWPQRMLAPELAWPLSMGDNVTVAVLDSGVDAGHPQLRGRVVADGLDLIDPANRGTVDCAGHGTEVAGIIAARSLPDVGFRGVAPRASILPARVSDSHDAGSGKSAGTPGLIQAIDWAIGRKAKVINISMTVADDDANLRAAVARAVSQDIVVVAAVGNIPSGQVEEGPPPYPAAYPGVLGVGAVDETGVRWPQSRTGKFVDLVAPGAGVTTTEAGGGLTIRDGTSYAAAFVSAAAALVRSRYPSVSAPAVARRLMATATPAPGGAETGEYGSGIVNPYAAVADLVTGAQPAALPGLAASQPNDAELADRAAWRSSANLALVLTGLSVLLALAVLGVARALPLGRLRRWRGGYARLPTDRPDEPEPSPPVGLFD